MRRKVPDEHGEGEEAPEGQIEAHGGFIGLVRNAELGKYPDGDEREPEDAVGGEGGGAEGVVLLRFEHAGDDLGDTAHKNAHAEDHGIIGIEAGIVDVE